MSITPITLGSITHMELQALEGALEKLDTQISSLPKPDSLEPLEKIATMKDRIILNRNQKTLQGRIDHLKGEGDHSKALETQAAAHRASLAAKDATHTASLAAKDAAHTASLAAKDAAYTTRSAAQVAAHTANSAAQTASKAAAIAEKDSQIAQLQAQLAQAETVNKAAMQALHDLGS